MLIELFAKTDVGRIRSGNEDNFLVLDLQSARSWTGSKAGAPDEGLLRFEVGERGVVLVVSDGMGGALAGDVASRMTVETVRDLLVGGGGEASGGEPPCGPDEPLVDCLRNAAEYANFAIHRRSQDDPRCSGMGATMTATAVTPEGVDFVQVGDSRGYMMRGSEIRLATKDQSLVQQLVDVGQISEQEAETHMFRNVILQALGAQAELLPVTGRVRVCRDDVLLLCSDGLSGKLRGDEMRRIVADAHGDLKRACEHLVAEANARGGEDNITVVLARFTGDDLPSPDSQRITVELPALDADNTMGGEDDTQHP
ncbi:MAG TPA: protein phosphatase 2C domain-containing protein [Pyrinomonadaceae bacterium]|nr:protein phosphatase 2C domain-containing protein [Pyrinomonadaceae bacterium]